MLQQAWGALPLRCPRSLWVASLPPATQANRARRVAMLRQARVKAEWRVASFLPATQVHRERRVAAEPRVQAARQVAPGAVARVQILRGALRSAPPVAG
jgi:hypothetical protein